MSRVLTVLKRELASYFETPVAGVFLVIFLFLAGLFAFNVGGLYEAGQADLRPFFSFHPWLYVFLMPAISMRLWAEERRTGTIELTCTLPLKTWWVVVGKFLAAWVFAGVALGLTFPIWVTVSWLGDPDHGVIAASYAGSWLMAGSFLAVGSCVSALTKNQVIAFVVCAAACFLLLVTGFGVVQGFLSGWAPAALVEGAASLSVLTHFDSLMRGVVDARDVIYFASMIAVFLGMNVMFVDWGKAR